MINWMRQASGPEWLHKIYGIQFKSHEIQNLSLFDLMKWKLKGFGFKSVNLDYVLVLKKIVSNICDDEASFRSLKVLA